MTEQRIIIVGGVAGGMSAAARMRRLDENSQITVLERGPYVSFANCGLPYYVGGEITDESALLVQTPAGLEASLNLDVRPHHDVVSIDSKLQTVTANTPDGPVTLAYDQLILAPGAVAVRPPIPGIDHPAVTALQTVDEATALVQRLGGGAKSAVVLGAGFIGLEAAEALQRRGLAVTVVELAPHVLPPLETELAYLVTAELRRLGLTVRAGVSAQQISDQAGQAVVSLSDGDSVTADIVVVAAGVRPDTALAEAAGVVCERGAIVVDEHGRTNLPHIWAAGDATLSQDAVTGARRPVMLAGPANRAGRLVADAIAADTSGRSARPIPRPLGTAIVRVGELTAALTGANRASLTAAGRAFTTLHLHPQDHAGYFPGAEQMHLVVHLDPATGQLLGAQGVGPAGVDKRIDILATALRTGLSAVDLMDLDLCYSPPYGAAKDPITMVGLVADNVMTGQLRLWQVEQLADKRKNEFVLDVRTPVEFGTGHLPEAVNIPHTELRQRLDEVRTLAAGRPVAVLCQSGVRSYIAHRILAAAGFESASLSGGMLTVRAWLGDQAQTELVV